jgi:hypothetical protein
MRSLIKGKAREIINDPKQSRELRQAILRLREASAEGKISIEANIGGHPYKIQFINQYSKKK